MRVFCLPDHPVNSDEERVLLVLLQVHWQCYRYYHVHLHNPVLFPTVGPINCHKSGKKI